MKKFRYDTALAALTMCFGIGVICYAVSRIDTAVYVSGVPEQKKSGTVIVLDAGQGASMKTQLPFNGVTSRFVDTKKADFEPTLRY